MRFRMKLLIFFVAVVLSGLEFFLISSPFVDLHMSSKKADTEISESYLAKCGVDKSIQMSCLHSFIAILIFCVVPERADDFLKGVKHGY